MWRFLFPVFIGRLEFLVRLLAVGLVQGLFIEPYVGLSSPAGWFFLALLVLSFAYQLVYAALPRIRDAEFPPVSLWIMLVPMLNVAFTFYLLFFPRKPDFLN